MSKRKWKVILELEEEVGKNMLKWNEEEIEVEISDLVTESPYFEDAMEVKSVTANLEISDEDKQKC